MPRRAEVKVDWARLRASAIELPAHDPPSVAVPLGPSQAEYERMTDRQRWAAWKKHRPAEYRRLRRQGFLLALADLLDPAGRSPRH